jgi:hypothetical protein
MRLLRLADKVFVFENHAGKPRNDAFPVRDLQLTTHHSQFTIALRQGSGGQVKI